MRNYVGLFFSLCFATSAAHADEAISITPEDKWNIAPSHSDTYMPEKLDFVTDDIEFDNPAPYVGLSFTDKNNKNKQWEFKANIGVKYNGDTDVTNHDDVSYQAQLVRKSWELENNSNELEFNPVVMMGLKYHF